ncbi:MAG TPA: TonB-dependent receptor, partial [Candidatus Acidoferrales bacterium]
MSGTTGAGRFDSSAVTYRINIGDGLAEMSQKELAFYVNDTWRLHPRFTLNVGLRWEGYFNPEADASNTAMTNQVANTAFPNGLRVNPAFIPDNLNQWMPRVGFAWDPWGDAKTVIRGNVGYYYARSPLLLFAGPLNNYRAVPGDLTVQLPFPNVPGCSTIYCQFLSIGIDLNNFSLSNLPTVDANQAIQIATALGLTVDPFRGAQPTAMADDYSSPRSLQWNIGIEREVARGWSVSADYAWVHTVHLQRNRDFNQPTPFINPADLSGRACIALRSATCTVGGAPLQSRPITNLGQVSVRETNARGLYRAFTFGSTYRQSRVQFQAYYTLGWNYSDDDNERSAGGFTLENAFNLTPEYNFAELDVRHQLLFNTVVDLPWGFTFSSLSRLRSSRPIDPTAGTDANGDIGGPDRPLQAVGVPFRRNSFRDRAEYQIDMRVAKRFNLPREGMAVDITADFFNLFNFDSVRFSSAGRIYGLGIGTNGQSAPIDSRFRRLTAPSRCLSANPTSGNPGCYDPTTTMAGFVTPFTVQLGARFTF